MKTKMLKFTSMRDGKFIYINPKKVTAVVQNASGVNIFTSEDSRAVPWCVADELRMVLKKLETDFDGRLIGEE